MSNARKSHEIIEEIIKITTEEKEEKEATIIEVKKNIDTKYYGIKKPLIIEAKNALIKEGFPKEKVTTEIVRKLEGFITEAYIRKCIDDPELKDASKVRKQIEVATGGQQSVSDVGGEGDGGDDNDNNNDLSAREQYERNKYYKNMPKIQNTTLMNKDVSVGIAPGVKNDAYPNEDQKLIRELKSKIDVLESERNMHTTVSIDKKLFPDIAKFIDDRKIRRVFLDFDENFTATKVRAEL